MVLTRDRHPCHLRDSNPQFQQASGRRTTPSTTRLLGPAHQDNTQHKYRNMPKMAEEFFFDS